MDDSNNNSNSNKRITLDDIFHSPSLRDGVDGEFRKSRGTIQLGSDLSLVYDTEKLNSNDRVMPRAH